MEKKTKHELTITTITIATTITITTTITVASQNQKTTTFRMLNESQNKIWRQKIKPMNFDVIFLVPCKQLL